jgi:hypothetical protein
MADRGCSTALDIDEIIHRYASDGSATGIEVLSTASCNLRFVLLRVHGLRVKAGTKLGPV